MKSLVIHKNELKKTIKKLPDAELSVGHYDSKEEAKADLKRLVDAYANRLPTIEL